MQLSEISNVLVISHYYKRTTAGGGPPQEIRDFLLPKIKKVYYIEHPFPQADDHRSSITIYSDGKIEKKNFTPSLRGPQILFYIFDIFLTFYFFLLIKKRIDVCIALDNLNTVNILPLKKIGLVKKLVFYTIDYNPKRFENKILNDIYHFLDRISCYYSDAIWVLSKKMDTTRAKNKVDIKKMAKSILLPMGANLERINILPLNKISRNQIAFTGFLMKKQGVQVILQALPEVIKKIPDVKFIIIGQGEYENQLKNLSKSLKITKHVDFKGFVNDHREVENILCKSAIGVATYEDTQDNYTMFTDPGKPKLYLGCGLPVVITNVPQVAKTIASRNAGLIVKYNKKSVADALIKLLSDENLYKNFRENAIKLSKEYNTNSLINNALKNTP
ncbi:glycosyltransferase [Candidatus Roizmanbacteria bacterium]|nr:glycosyltransferase [Candidatus Roizmanbacteria bacterium]